MASEASRSSNGAADSYIGSLISLISKSENRYQGILHDLNTEESNIGLSNVQSFGTEGRKKDGPQVPPSDKVYEYILFRGRDIKDLQVKASPPVQSPQPIHIDPAIIQSQYSRAPSVSTSLPFAGSGPVTDPSSHAAQMAIPVSTVQGGFPLYQPGGSLGSLGSSTPLTDASGLSMPMPWQGFYPSLNSYAQQPFSQPTPGLSMPHSMQQPLYPGISSPLLTGSSNMIVPTVPGSNMLGFNRPAFNLPASNLREFTSPLLPPFSIGTANLTSTTLQSTLPLQSAILASESLPSLMPNMVSGGVPATAPLSDTLPLASQSTTSILDTNPITAPATMRKTAPILSLPHQTAPHHVSPNVGAVESNHNETSKPPLVTPRQLLQPNLSTISSSLSSDPAKKVAKVVEVTSSKPPASGPVTTQSPILPLPPPANHKLNGSPVHTLQNQPNRGHERGRGNGRSFIPSGNDGGHERGRGNGRSFIPSGNDRGHERGRGNGRSFIPSGNDRAHERGRGNGIISFIPSGNDRGRERGRGNGISRHVTNFTEEFDFIAMNEKFKKDEVWGDLDKTNKTKNREDDRHKDDGDVFKLDDDAESLKLEKPVYVKDDFFDSISCDSLENGQRNGRRFSEQRKVDGETFGDFPRHRSGRGGRWPGRGGRSLGYYYGTGYGYVGRGRGTN